MFDPTDNIQYVTVDLLSASGVVIVEDPYFQLCLSNPTEGQLAGTQCTTVLIANEDSK